MKHIGTHVYAVGLLRDWRRGHLRKGAGYLWSRARQRKWRNVRNYFNGYLAEHHGHHHNAGRGWTRRAAERRVERLCQTWRRAS